MPAGTVSLVRGARDALAVHMCRCILLVGQPGRSLGGPRSRNWGSPSKAEHPTSLVKFDRCRYLFSPLHCSLCAHTNLELWKCVEALPFLQLVMSNSASYKQQKEDFVSNLSGGSVAEINYVTSVAAVALVLWSVLQSRQSFFEPYTLLAFAVDFLLNVGAILLSTTLYSNSPLLLNLLLIAPAILIFTLPTNSTNRKKKAKVPLNARSGGSGQLDVLSTKPFLTNFRGCMMIVTCVAILAVDFRLFPRRFAKVETWGTSLMDLGVGSFVFAGGLVAARPVLREKATGRTTGRATSVIHRIIHSMRHSIPLLVLGLIRLLSVKGLDYAEHVTEYGVHWNFFFTLGFLPPFVAIFQAALRWIPSFAALSLLIGVSYQVLLETTDLKAYVLTAPRTDLISMNREGIFSFFGYLAIFLAGQDVGMFAIPRNISPKSTASPGAQRNTLLMTMAVWGGVWTGLYLLSTSYTYGFGLTVSRRLANLPYVLWVIAFNTMQVFGFAVVDTVFFPAFYNAQDAKSEKEAYIKSTSRVIRAYNRNGLAVFLLANLLTGLVNMTFRTLDASPVQTIGILVAYMSTVTGVAVALDSYNISIKL
ncbi:hypothetical protein FZEAL_4752 [Fusarium zealandicum]|uniref:GPI-anchored wall transfer protein n=1 Tax=Fusarium zealandicum TaxID=1053134 RepID=A0A8H4ULV1_9HYPO|nr:hypothetical protein FZEAL_4752 [Fusarium zealandicum]